MKAKIYLVILLIIPALTFAQGVAINTDDSEADPSAMLEIKSSDKGLLIPRMTQSEIENIANPANGLIVFNTTEDKFFTFIASEVTWKEIAYGTSTIVPFGDGSIGTGSSCDNTGVFGDYKTGQALGATEFVTIEVNVSAIGAYSFTTNTVNGYSFSASGVYSSTGVQTVDLAGSGTPVAYQTDIFTATASNGGGTCSFDVLINVACGGTLTDSRDAQNYNTVQIGTQCWMQENLNIGTMINGSNAQTDNSTIEKYCSSNNTANCDVYGGFYQWDEMMEYETTPGASGICPSGWHLPDDDEWCTLENGIDAGTIDCGLIDWRGSDAGGNLKETGISHWNSPNTGATNSSGFTALPGGYRRTDGTFTPLGINNITWSSSEDGSLGWYRGQNFDMAQVYRNSLSKAYGFSVRCLQDEANINQAPEQPSNPSPADASTGQSVNSTLSWTCSDPDGYPLTYDVYFGETNPPALVSSGQSATTYNPGTLNINFTYYWKITAHDIHSNSTEGVVWSFTTALYGEVYNPATGKTWMDRNLGASQIATSSDDAAAFGDLYQWGRAKEGHEIRTSGTTSTHATTAVPNAGNSWDGLFIPDISDWLTIPDNTLWQGESGTNNPCPIGFRIPTSEEWIAEQNSWTTNDPDGAFSSQLKLPAAAFRHYNTGLIEGIGHGNYWSSTVNNSFSAEMHFSTSAATGIYNERRAYGFSVRCIKAVNQPPSQPTNPLPADASTDQAVNSTLSWTCSDPDGDPLTYDVYFGETNPPALVSSGQQDASYDPGALNNSTTYYWKITAHDNYTNSTEGSVWSFTTEALVFSCGNQLNDARDAQSYNTVQIGTQCWMAENLNIGTMINGNSNQTNNSIIEKYCNGDNPSNCDTYGGLYQWNEMMEYTTTDGTQGICPMGWHIPTDSEFTILSNFLGGESIAGGKMKEVGTTHWNSPNTGATNSSGFLGLPGGQRHQSGSFNHLFSFANYWSSSEANSNAWRWYLGYYFANIYRTDGSGKNYGYSVRCLKD